MRIALVGPAHPYKGGGARHTTELAHRLAAAGHDVVIESWRAMYPSALYPGVQTVQVTEGDPYPRTRRLLSWRRPDSWLRAGLRLRGTCDVAVFVYLAPVQVPAYLAIMWGLRRRTAAGASRPRAVVICHNVLPHERRPGDVALTRALLRRGDAALTHTERLARAARHLAPGTPVGVAAMPPHLPASPESRDPAAPEVTEARVPAMRRLLFFGIVRPYKGLDILLRAMALAPDSIALTVAGEFWGGTGPRHRRKTRGWRSPMACPLSPQGQGHSQSRSPTASMACSAIPAMPRTWPVPWPGCASRAPRNGCGHGSGPWTGGQSGTGTLLSCSSSACMASSVTSAVRSPGRPGADISWAPARSSRRTRIATTTIRNASSAIPAATRNPREMPTASAWCSTEVGGVAPAFAAGS